MPCQELKAKGIIRVRTPKKKTIVIETKYWIIWVQIAKSSSPSMSWKLNASLTQKDIMDRRAWIKFIRKGIRRTQKDIKSTNEKCQVAWEWGTNEYFCLPCVTILWCLSWNLTKDRGKMKFIYLALKELYWLWNLGFHFPKLDYPQWLKVHISAIWEIHTSRRIQHVGFIVKQSVT